MYTNIYYLYNKVFTPLTNKTINMCRLLHSITLLIIAVIYLCSFVHTYLYI